MPGPMIRMTDKATGTKRWVTASGTTRKRAEAHRFPSPESARTFARIWAADPRNAQHTFTIEED